MTQEKRERLQEEIKNSIVVFDKKYVALNIGKSPFNAVVSKDWEEKDIPSSGIRIDTYTKFVYKNIGDPDTETGLRISMVSVKRKFVPTQSGKEIFVVVKQILSNMFKDKPATILILGPPMLAEAFPGEVYTFNNDHGKKQSRIDDLMVIEK